MTFTTLAIVYFRFLPLFFTHSIPFAFLATIDYLFFGTGALLGIFNVLIFASSIIVVSLVSRQAFKNQREQLKKATKCKVNTNVNLVNSVATFRTSHTQFARFLATFNRALSAKFFSSFLLGNLAYNAYSFMFIAYNRDHSAGPFFRLAFSCWQVIHAMAPVSVATFVVKINRQMYAAQEVLCALLATTTFQILKTVPSYSSSYSSSTSKVLSIPLFREQWKLSCYLELLDRGENARKTKTMAMTAAIFGVALERKTMFEFALIYAAFLMHFGGWIVQNKKEAELK